MRCVSLDLETTSLDPATGQIIEIGLVAVDTNSEKGIIGEYSAFVLPNGLNGRYVGEADAMFMHRGMIQEIHNLHMRGSIDDRLIGENGIILSIVDHLQLWGFNTDKIVLAGKNIGGFDMRFLRATLFFDTYLERRISHRFLDVGPLSLRPSDMVVPDLPECASRWQVPNPNPMSHRALDDARVVANIILSWHRHGGVMPQGEPS